MTDVLVIYAGKMGSTRQIAETIREELRTAGLSVDVRTVADAPGPAGYRAVVLGSAIYLRRWQRDAVRYLRRNRTPLRELPVWLFQSGPIDPHTITQVPWSVRRICTHSGIRPPTTFGGRLDATHANGVLARWMASSDDLRGDGRDWDAIRGWAGNIHDSIAKTPKHSDNGLYHGPAIVISPQAGGSRHSAFPPTDSSDPHALGNLW